MRPVATAYVPLVFAPAEACQFDWSHEIVVLGGVTRKRQRAFEVIFGELLRAEIADKQARSIRYQLGTRSAIRPSRALASGEFMAQQCNVVLIGGTGTGKTSSGNWSRPKLHPQRLQGALLQCRRLRQPA